MKHILLFCIFSISSLLVYGQCDPQTDFGDEDFGVAPDTIVNFVSGDLGVLYVQQVDVKVPADGSFTGAPFITVDSVSLAGILGLPPGLSYECATQTDGPCTFIGGTLGCAVISGIPEAEGLFELQVLLEVHTTGLGSIPFPFEGYRITIGDVVSSTVDSSNPLGIKPHYPNPANDFTRIAFNAPKSGEGLLSVYDLVGKLVLERNVRLNHGNNEVKLYTADFQQGLYIVRLDAFGQSASQRLAVSR